MVSGNTGNRKIFHFLPVATVGFDPVLLQSYLQISPTQNDTSCLQETEVNTFLCQMIYCKIKVKMH